MRSTSLWAAGVGSVWPLARLKDHVDLVNGYPFAAERFNATVGTPLVRIRDLLKGSTATCSMARCRVKR